MTTSENKQLVVDFIQALFTKGDLSAIDRYLAPDFVNHDEPLPGGPTGAAGMRAAATVFRDACPDWHSEVARLVAEDDIVVEQFTASGTHRGELMGVAGTGQTITLYGINIFRVRHGQIVERWGSLDLLGVLRQLGLAS